MIKIIDKRCLTRFIILNQDFLSMIIGMLSLKIRPKIRRIEMFIRCSLGVRDLKKSLKNSDKNTHNTHENHTKKISIHRLDACVLSRYSAKTTPHCVVRLRILYILKSKIYRALRYFFALNSACTSVMTG